nr:hypothetical protein [Desulfobacula sp.]
MIKIEKYDKSWLAHKQRLWRKMQTFAVLLITVILTACYKNCLPTVEVRDSLTTQLRVGDPREKIEAVLGNVVAKYDNTLVKPDIAFSYDEFQNRYSTTIWDKPRCGPYQGISVDIHLDDTGHLSKIDVHELYTMP